jgi:hypothetical protein
MVYADAVEVARPGAFVQLGVVAQQDEEGRHAWLTSQLLASPLMGSVILVDGSRWPGVGPGQNSPVVANRAVHSPGDAQPRSSRRRKRWPQQGERPEVVAQRADSGSENGAAGVDPPPRPWRRRSVAAEVAVDIHAVGVDASRSPGAKSLSGLMLGMSAGPRLGNRQVLLKVGHGLLDDGHAGRAKPAWMPPTSA